ncbi:ER oxidoreductin Ero1b [Schizosaccharomyces japonicus yFS275]|uniref:ER oxidoreductin Ero1b n=1 Tax=Schizosaccharomyces japonicus (strain yFS275 / FY16936) TaxID=402676 RepID=B6K2M2_SCHJY|nr:ER oxidoreductin Ero1b [Schizosaccharomyces japonicus yFS275]EEB07403.1 ER oxidoreductin Ero1b [Schizosaccharomyces japonicus yFS275]
MTRLLSFSLFLTSILKLVACKENSIASQNEDIDNITEEIFQTDYNTVDALNEEFKPLVTDLTEKSDYFRYYRLNLFNRECKFPIIDHAVCGNSACTVNVLKSENDIPRAWRSSALGRLEGFLPRHAEDVSRASSSILPGNKQISPSCLKERDTEDSSKDYCYIDDDEDENCVYVSLLDNPERFTGYSGPHATLIWRMIYNECLSEHDEEPMSPFENSLAPHEKLDNRLQDIDKYMELWSLEEHVFYRILSGMHSSVSTHLCYHYFNQSSGLWVPNLECFVDRVYNHPSRVENLYFDYAVLLRALGKLDGWLDELSFCYDDSTQDSIIRKSLRTLTRAATKAPKLFDEHRLFTGDAASAEILKDEFRMHFRNVSALMDCVGCEKCRLWGKIQTNGLGTALKILLEFPEHDTDFNENQDTSNTKLHQAELASLVNTFDRISRSIQYFHEFEKMYEEAHRKPSMFVRMKTSMKSVIFRITPPSTHNFIDRVNAFINEVCRDFVIEFHNVMEAFKFVLGSYLQIPSLFRYYFLSKESPLWNSVSNFIRRYIPKKFLVD